MPIEMTLDMKPAGYTAHDVMEGEDATLLISGFIPADDKDQFKLFAIDGIPGILINHIPKGTFEDKSPINEMIGILRNDLTATLYLDKFPGELDKEIKVIAKKDIDLDEELPEESIVDIKKFEYKNIVFPPDAGIAAVFKVGNRRGYFFDLAPITENNPPRQFDVGRLLGNLYVYLGQQPIFEIDDDTWGYLIGNQWFPFIALTTGTRNKLIDAAKAKSNLDDLLPDIALDVTNSCENLRSRIQKHSLFSDHSRLLEHALNEYQQGDYISSTSIIYPRIEGIMRTLYKNNGSLDNPGQTKMIDTIVEPKIIDNSGILLLPEKFRKFLKKVYFAEFGKRNKPDTVSRNSVSHGVAKQEDINLKSATIGLLILDQLSFFLPDENP